MKTIRKFRKWISIKLLFMFVFSILSPSISLALASGPTQPEVTSFTPVQVSEMVNPFTGDFSYNIPLLDVDGYPVNISYSSSVGMEDEASWVGLGWNLSVGSVNRNMRGIPDDFSGDYITKELNMKPSRTVGLKGSWKPEIFGFDLGSIPEGSDEPEVNNPFTASLGIYFNNYTGFGFEKGLSVSINSGKKARGPLNGSLGISSDSNNGISIQPAIGLTCKASEEACSERELGLSLGTSWNTRAGLRQVSFSTSFEQKSYDTASKVSEFKKSTVGDFATCSSFPVGTQTYQPSVGMEMENTSVSARFTTGAAFLGLHANTSLNAYYSSQGLKEKEVSNPAYGMMYHEYGENHDNAILDFNREQDVPYTENTPVMPLASFTPDIFTVTGQGVGGSYRVFRGDVGHVFDARASSTGSGGNVGIEHGIGNIAHGGLAIDLNISETESHKWTEGNAAQSGLSSRYKVSGDLYEPYYFAEANEFGASRNPYFTAQLGGTNTLGMGLYVNDDKANLAGAASSGSETVNFSNSNRTERENRVQSFSILNWHEVTDGYGLYRSSINQMGVGNGMSNSQIGQITTTGDNGSKYVYAIPVVNSVQKDVTFAIGKGLTASSTGLLPNEENLIQYTSGDNSIDNSRGLDNYFSRTTTPGYAYSYLLSAVLSSDYVDSDGVVGPSKDDLGTYTHFKYTKVASAYKWRMPMTEEVNTANYSSGVHADPRDDKANYIYGEKEIYYLSSIETKNYVAIFHISTRNDAVGAAGENGGISSAAGNRMYKLDKIELFSAADYYGNANSIPIKTVHFEYDYSLCQGIPNKANGSGAIGKLTLKSIYFTYQNSKTGALSPYRFNYSNFNPQYNRLAVDRWGNYKPETGDPTDFISTNTTNAEFPYTLNDNSTDIYATAWLLTSINLMSGGTISVDYISDEYAYVQNKKVNQMFHMVGVGPNPDPGDDPVAYPQANGAVKFDENDRFYFELDPNNLNISSYFEGIEQPIYMRCYVNMKPGLFAPDEGYDYIPVYLNHAGYGIVEDFDPDGTGPKPEGTYGYIKFSSVPTGDLNVSSNIHPLSLAAIQYGRVNAPNVVNNDLGSDLIGDDASLGLQLLEELAQFILSNNLGELFVNANKSRYNNGVGRFINPGKSFIRLGCPNKVKKGGGARVSRILISDNWADMSDSSAEDQVFGQVYDYRLENGSCSGVATYEPILGGDENPFRKFYNYNMDIAMAPDESRLIQTPIGESFYPSPSVGYSRVEIKSYIPPQANVNRHGTGKTIQEFYTAKDFPTIVKIGGIQSVHHKTGATNLLSLLNIDSRDNLGVSQSFVVELNDMHGKQKAQYIYAEGQSDPISSVKYTYKTDNGLGTGHLKNSAKVIHRNGLVDEQEIGVHFDMVADSRESNSKSIGSGASTNFETFTIGATITVPIIFPSYSSEKTQFRSFTTTKLIQRFGILEKVVATDNTSVVETSNLAYSAETGQLLLTETINNFDKPIYSLTMPAYWHYDMMGMEQLNSRFSKENVLCNSEGVATISGNNPFVEGDIVIMSNATNSLDKRVWVDDVSQNQVRFIYKNGAPVTGLHDVTIIESGRTNQSSAPMAQIQLLSNPLYSIGSNIYENVIQASAIEYDGTWEADCNCYTKDKTNLSTSNKFVLGIKGNWRPSKNYAYLGERYQSVYNNNTDIKKDGVLQSFTPFYQLENDSWRVNRINWTFASETTRYSHNGLEVESRDALGRYSSAQLGYNSTLPIAIASNAKQTQMGFAHFEDHTTAPNCRNKFAFYGGELSANSHTGKKSLKVTSANPAYYEGTLWEDCERSDCEIIGEIEAQNNRFILTLTGATLPISVSTSNQIGDMEMTNINGNIMYFDYRDAGSRLLVDIVDANGCTYQILLIAN